MILVSGCVNYLNHADVEVEISNTFEARTGLALQSVTCPPKVPVKKGGVFQCEGILEEGQSFNLTVTQTDNQETISWDAKGSLQTLKGIVDNERLAAQITAGIKAQSQIEVITDCGDLFRVARAGDMFTCMTIDQQQNQSEVMVKANDDQGNVSWEL